MMRTEEVNGGRNGNRRNRKYPPIQDVIERGQELLVQVTKEPIGTKGPRVTTQASLPGRFIVYMPDSNHVGVSRKIDDREERSRLKKMGREAIGRDQGGIIIRTVGEELTKKTLVAEFKSLRRTWEKVQRRVASAKRAGQRAPRGDSHLGDHPGPVQREDRFPHGGLG